MSRAKPPPSAIPAILPLEFTAEHMAQIDARAAACGMDRMAYLLRCVVAGLDAVEAGHPLPSLDALDDGPPPESGPRDRGRP